MLQEHSDQPTRALSEIEIPDRHRKDLGDLDSLARSIAERGGLLQPIVIDKRNVLIAGERRLRAWQISPFNWLPIPVHVVDIDSIVAGEWDENTQRKDFTPSEMVAIKRALEPIERAKALERQVRGVKAENAGQAADKIARKLGRNRKTIAKAEDVVNAAEQDRDRFGFLVEQMDKTGKVDWAYRQLRILRGEGAAISARHKGRAIAKLRMEIRTLTNEELVALVLRYASRLASARGADAVESVMAEFRAAGRA